MVTRGTLSILLVLVDIRKRAGAERVNRAVERRRSRILDSISAIVGHHHQRIVPDPGLACERRSAVMCSESQRGAALAEAAADARGTPHAPCSIVSPQPMIADQTFLDDVEVEEDRRA